MEESEYKEMLALGGMRQKHFEKNEVDFVWPGCTTHEIGLVLSGALILKISTWWGSKSFEQHRCRTGFSGKLMHFPAKH